LRQRYTIDLNRYPYQQATIEITAEGLVEAQAKALDMARSPDFPWITEDPGGARVTKVIVYAEEVTDEPDWSQQDAPDEVIRAWMKEHAKGGDAETLARAAYEHFARPFHLDVLRKMAAEIMA
jgi:hypothetical protein